jgi:mono/diheme cytochrome c family protein
MRTVLRWLLRLILLLVLIIVAFVGYVYWRSAALLAKTYDVKVPEVTIPTDEASVARGKHLVETVSMCIECHEKDLGGKIFADDFAFGRLSATNLTRGSGGIGKKYSDKDYVRALMHGVRRDRHSVLFMPSADYTFTEADLGAIVAYVRSVPPVDRELPSPSIGPFARTLSVVGNFPMFVAELIDHDNVKFAKAADVTTPVAAGDYLVSTAGCRGCHGPDMVGGGGPPPGGSNITPVGLDGWTDHDFITAIRDHKRPNGTAIAEEMPRAYGQMSDEDLRKIFDYLKTLPPKGEKTKNQAKTTS